MLTALRILNIVIWAGLLVYALPGAWATVRAKDVRRGDAWRLSVVSVAGLFILGNIRWLVAPNDPTFLLVVTTLSVVVAAFKARLLRAYGRGPTL